MPQTIAQVREPRVCSCRNHDSTLKRCIIRHEVVEKPLKYQGVVREVHLFDIHLCIGYHLHYLRHGIPALCYFQKNGEVFMTPLMLLLASPYLPDQQPQRCLVKILLLLLPLLLHSPLLAHHFAREMPHRSHIRIVAPRWLLHCSC